MTCRLLNEQQNVLEARFAAERERFDEQLDALQQQLDRSKSGKAASVLIELHSPLYSLDNADRVAAYLQS